MQHIDFIELQKLISAERLEPYLKMAANDSAKAVELYYANLDESSILYNQFHWLEVILRNSINKMLSSYYGNEWYKSNKINFGDVERDKISKAIRILENEGKPVSNPNVVASLTLGFWVSLFNSRYDNVWRYCLRRAFPATKHTLQRKDLSSRLHPLLKMRNRIAHYEPILKYNLSQLKQDIIDILGWVEPNFKQKM